MTRFSLVFLSRLTAQLLGVGGGGGGALNPAAPQLCSSRNLSHAIMITAGAAVRVYGENASK